jgi:hypothetical protein
VTGQDICKNKTAKTSELYIRNQLTCLYTITGISITVCESDKQNLLDYYRHIAVNTQGKDHTRVWNVNITSPIGPTTISI